MGQRHQLFVIANINGRYRTLCAIHHQWLYGQTALKRCLATLKIFADPANKVPLEQELIAARLHDEAFWTATTATRAEYDKKNSHVPFPFIATCLVTGASFDAEEGYYHGVLMEPFDMAYDEGDNNNGITIFDISDLSNVRYCFVDFYGMESVRPVQLMTPLTARIYLEAEYDLNDPKHSQIMVPLVNKFNAWNVIPVATLQDTWPEGEWEEPESDEEGRDLVAVTEAETLEIETPSISKSLRNSAMDYLLKTLLDGSDENDGLLSHAELLTDFVPKLKEKLYEQSNALKPSPHVLDLLCSALGEDTDVDLSPFKAFSAEDMSRVVSRLCKRGKMHSLCISNRPDLTPGDLQVVLRDATGLKALYLLEDPQISGRIVSPLLKDCDMYTSDLMRRAMIPGSRGSLSDSKSRGADNAVPARQACANNDISQLVWIGVSYEQALDKSHRLESGLIDWKTLQQEKRRTNFGWSKPGLKYKRYPLDSPLSTSRTVAGLLCLLQWASASDIYDIEQISTGAALSFAMASSIQGNKESSVNPTGVCRAPGIGPLVRGLYWGTSYEREFSDDVLEHLEPGEWAVILIHEAYNAVDQDSLDRPCARRIEAESDSEDENPLGQPKEGEQSSGGVMASILEPTEPLEKKGKNPGLPFRAIKRLRYVLVTQCDDPQSPGRDFIVADIPTYLEHITEANHDNVDARNFKTLSEAWNSGIAAIDAVGFYGDDDIHDILPKVFPKQKAASSSSTSM